jgi:hypothetical protein
VAEFNGIAKGSEGAALKRSNALAGASPDDFGRLNQSRWKGAIRQPKGLHETIPCEVVPTARAYGESYSTVKWVRTKTSIHVDGALHGNSGGHPAYNRRIVEAIGNPLAVGGEMLGSHSNFGSWGEAFTFYGKVFANRSQALVEHPFSIAYGVQGRIRSFAGNLKNNEKFLKQLFKAAEEDIADDTLPLVRTLGRPRSGTPSRHPKND